MIYDLWSKLSKTLLFTSAIVDFIFNSQNMKTLWEALRKQALSIALCISRSAFFSQRGHAKGSPYLTPWALLLKIQTCNNERRMIYWMVNSPFKVIYDYQNEVSMQMITQSSPSKIINRTHHIMAVNQYWWY